MMKGSRFFDKNPVVQGRFEEIEDWVEELDTELDKLIEQNKLIKSKLEEIQVLLNDRLQ
jgi:chaperonin cofactor prefoldin